MRYFLEVSYKGTAYHGWQSQSNSISIQDIIEQALGTALSSKPKIVGSSRTDTGVHAEQQFAHFDINSQLDCAKIQFKMNSILPRDVCIKNILPVNQEAHARYDAYSRTYQYRIDSGKDPFLENLVYYYRLPLNIDVMNAAAQILLKNDNFESFSRVKTEVNNFICKLEACHWFHNGRLLIFEITSNRFLRGMVRAITGTLLEIGLEKMPLSNLQPVIDSKDRGKAGRAVPACGLFLTKVEYPRGYFK